MKDVDDPQRDGSEGRRIDKMEEKPYRGPGDQHGISAHGIEGETDLRSAKEYAEMIVDTVREGLLVLDFDLRVEAANESFYRMFEVPSGETEGRLIYELGNGQWDIPQLRELLEEILPERKVMAGFKVTHDFESVGRRIMLLNARQLNDHERILLAIEDVTEHEEAEELLHVGEEKLRKMNRSLERRVRQRMAELRQQTGQLRRLAVELTSAEQRERRRLAALLHDDLQQQLYSAEMQLSMARDKAEPGSALADAIEEASKRVKKAVEGARDLTRQLRPPALYEAGLTPALKWLASDMADRHDLDVSVETDDMATGTVERSVSGDVSDDIKAMLFDCARELLFNVVKHAGVSEARVALRTDTGDTDTGDANYLHLIVEDEGRGFDVETASETGLGQEAEGGKGVEDGAGFGLLSIRERLAALGGSMATDSSVGEGTRIELALPLAAASGKPAPPPALADDHEEGPSDATPRRAQVRVVVADDHAVVRQGIANLLVGDGRTTMVGEAADGHEAVEAVERTRPDVVLMDVNMPKMNGVEATGEIHRRWPETPVVGLSVQADHATRQSMLNAGAAAFVPKSGDADRMIETVLRVTGRSSETEE